MKKRIAIKIHPASMVLFAVVFLFADSHLAIAVLLALAVHEMAHFLAMLICGTGDCRIEITPFGGMMDARQFARFSSWKQFLISGAGVASSGMTAWICWFMLPKTLFVQRFFQANVSLAFLNILPLWPLDGARMLTAFAMHLRIEQPVKKILSVLSVITGMLLVVLGLYGVWNGIINPTLLAAGPYLCYASRTEMVTASVRRLGNIEHKLLDGEILPVKLLVGNETQLRDQFISQLSRATDNRYQVLMAVDPDSGQIRKCWTEQEMLKHLLLSDRN